MRLEKQVQKWIPIELDGEVSREKYYKEVSNASK
jgi:hypothetical protein